MFKSKKLISLVVIAIVIISFLGFIKRRYAIPILMYHSVSPLVEKNDRLKITPDNFDRQMHFLRAQRYNIITLEEVADLLRNNKKIPARTIAVTFDDGYRDNYTYAYPILKKYRIPATIFIIVSEVGRVQGDRLFWNKIKDMQSSGLITLGSHTFNHPWLPEVASDDILKNEIMGSKKVLEDKIGAKVNSFCYPGGRLNAKIKKTVIDSGYKVAVATKAKGMLSNTDIFALRRIRVSQSSNNLFIFWAQTSGYYNVFQEGKKK